MSQRPKRSVSQPICTALAGKKTPKWNSRSVSENEADPYGVEDEESSRVRSTRYNSDSSSDDTEEMLELSDEETDFSDDQPVPDAAVSIPAKPFSLLEEVAARIKGALFSNLKGDPVCRVVMPFDKILFDKSLAVRGSIQHEQLQAGKSKLYYAIPHLMNYNDIFGERWYIRGINAAGDFCYVIPGTAKFYLIQNRRKIDYQLQKDGKLQKKYIEMGFELVFSFVRGDGNMLQWENVLKQCEL